MYQMFEAKHTNIQPIMYGMQATCNIWNKIKHEYLRSRAYICLSLSSPASPEDISIRSWTIEILVLTSWIPASKNFNLKRGTILDGKKSQF